MFRLRLGCWEGVSHTKTTKKLQGEGRAFRQRDQQMQRPWGKNELAFFFVEQKDGSWNTVSTEWGRKIRVGTAENKSRMTMNSTEFSLHVSECTLHTCWVWASPWTLDVHFLFWSLRKTYKADIFFFPHKDEKVNWPSDLFNNLPKITQVRSREIYVYLTLKFTVPLSRLYCFLDFKMRLCATAENVREQRFCVCVCVCVFNKGFLGVSQIISIGWHFNSWSLKHCNLNLFSAESMMFEGEEQERREQRRRLCNFLSMQPHLIRCHTTQTDEERGVKLPHHKCDFARSSDSNTNT